MKIENQNSQSFIKINNKFIIEDSEDHLSTKELYLYSLLLFEKHMKDHLKTNLSLIGSIIGERFGNARPDKRNIDIKKTLKLLTQRKVINITSLDGELVEDFKHSDLIVIHFGEHHKAKTRFTAIQEEIFYEINDIYHYHIYVIVKKWDGRNYFECAYDRWENILRKSRQFTIDKINEATESKIIYRTVGDYYTNEALGKKIQQANRYRIRPFEYNEKSNIDKKKIAEEVNKSFHEEHSYTSVYELNLNTCISVFKTEELDGVDIYPQKKDYMFYLQVKDKITNNSPSKSEQSLVIAADGRISKLKQSSSIIFQSIWDESLSEYKSLSHKSEPHKQVSLRGEDDVDISAYF